MAVNGGEKKYLGVDLRLARICAAWLCVDVTLRADGRCGCGGGDRWRVRASTP
jgi:hypothetical protein